MAADTEFYRLTEQETLRKLGTNIRGLSAEEAEARLKKYGENQITKKRRISSAIILARQFTSPLVILLVAATLISAAIAHFVDAAVIGAILVLNAVLGFVQEYRAEKSVEALQKLIVPKAAVVRGGKRKVVSSLELVPGDIIILKAGDKVAADCRLLRSFSLKADESVLTGESVAVEKHTRKIGSPVPLADRRNCVFSGTTIVYGKGMAAVYSTGMETELGHIAELVQETEERATPLQKRLSKTSLTIGEIVVGIGAAIFALGVLEGLGVFEMFLTAVSLAVAAVPEGLPAVVTIALSIGMQRMAKCNAVIRKLPVVEALGSCSYICTDKTGTLTKNEMTVREVFVDNKRIEVTGQGYEPKGKFLFDGKLYDARERHLDLLLKIGALCNDSNLVKDERWTVIGDPTEGALVVAAAKAGLFQENLRSAYPEVAELSFDEIRKRMSTINRTEGGYAVFTKGAPDVLLEHCTKIMRSGRTAKLGPKEKERILGEVNRMASNALRVLGMAYRPLKKMPRKLEAEEIENDLIFVGLVGMMDPLRPESVAAVREARSAKIKVAMVTGDHVLTAKAIGSKLELVQPGSLIFEGRELDSISQEELTKVIEDVSIFARVSPKHKVRIVEALQRRGHIVAMTGDGINDAPALKKADIGIAMGISGTDVAKEASQMVLEDDNFSTIVKSVREGRTIYDNIKKFVNYLLTSNTGEVAVIFAASLLFLPLPLIAVQILWMNLLTDGLPALALGIDPPEKDIMKRPPRAKDTRIIDREMLKAMVLTAALMTIGTLGLYWFSLQSGVERARTIALATLVMFQIARIQAVRTEYKTRFFANPWLLVAIASSVALLLAIIYIPLLSELFATEPLSIVEWVYVLAVAGFGFAALTAYSLWKPKP